MKIKKAFPLITFCTLILIGTSSILFGFKNEKSEKVKAQNTKQTLTAEYNLPEDRVPDYLDRTTADFIHKLNGAFVRSSERAIPSVVSVRTIRTVNEFGFSPHEEHIHPLERFHEEFFKRFFGRRQSFQKTNESHGSGFFVSEDGYVVTNYHVVQHGQEFWISRTNEAEELSARLIISDPKTDLAILKVESDESFPYLELGNSDHVQTGEWVIAIGSPFKLSHTVTAGVISSTDRHDLHINELEDFFQTDANINPGNSGGPLLDLYGRVIGVNTVIALCPQTGGNSGIGFAIKSNIIRCVLNQVAESGTLTRGYLGVQPQPLDPQLAKQFGYSSTNGALVAEVIPDSPAEKAGIKPGDIIMAIDGKSVQSPQALRNLIQLLPEGKKIDITIFRNGKQLTISASLGISDPVAHKQSELEHKLGFCVEEITDKTIETYKLNSCDQGRGVIVTHIDSRSLAYTAGIRKGTIILAVNHEPISTPQEFERAVNESKKERDSALLLIQQRGQGTNVVRFIALRLNKSQ